MNATTTTTNAGGQFSGENIGGLSYGIGVTFAIMIVIIAITLASYYCTRTPSPGFVLPTTTPPPSPPPPLDEGLDEATLTSYPKLLYSEAKAHRRERDSTATCCSICLADYRATDTLRLLPECGHLFHLRCVDPWLRLHSTCPVCRTSPMITPLAEVAPRATRPSGLR